MRASRGMGAVMPSKLKSKGNPCEVEGYAKGGEVWDKKRPKSLGAPKKMAPKKKARAKAMAKSAGRPYPNLVDNMRAAKG
jgi:hypothetical protein